MNRYKIITQHDAGLVSAWYQKAVNDSQVFRFLSGADYFNTDLPKESNWDYTYVMDNNHQALLWMKSDRCITRCVSMGLHALSGPGQQFAAGVLLKAAPLLARSYLGGDFLEWNVHETNIKSLMASHAIGGDVWGKRDAAMWDPALSQAVGSFHFRINLKAKS